MKIKLLISFIFLFISTQTYTQTPTDGCDDGTILNVDTEYSINNLNTNQFGLGNAIDGESINGNKVRGFWLRVKIPSGYYAENIEIYDVSDNFDPVIGLKSNCNFNYYPNIDNNKDYANKNGQGKDELFKTGITGAGNGGDGIYHIRIYHYDNSETPSVSFKIKITDDSTNNSSDFDLYVSNEKVEDTNPNIGDRITLSCRQYFSGNCDCDELSPDPEIGYFLSTNQSYESGVDRKIGTDSSNIGNDDDYDNESFNWTIPSDISPGNYYILFVTDYDKKHTESDENNNTESVAITIGYTTCEPIKITQQPNNQTVTDGNKATFSISVTGTTPISYQWKKNGNDITGANSATYTTPNLNSSEDGSTYQCEITNCGGTKISNTVDVTITNNCEAVSISQHPQNQSKKIGETATFSISVNGTSPFSYQWKKNGNNITGANNSSYTITSLSISDNGNKYSCYITNCGGSKFTTTQSANLSVTSNTPSELIITTSNTTLKNVKTLWPNNDNINYIKVCADGSKSTKLKFLNNTTIEKKNIGFKIIPSTSDINQFGTFLEDEIDTSSNDNIITAIYTHPTTYSNSSNFKENISFVVFDKNNPNSSNYIIKIPVRIYKTPVLMVHGLWGNADGFNEMEKYFFNVGYNKALTKKVNYCDFAGNSFYSNRWVVPRAIISLLSSTRESDFSCGKVDIVAHSMGGILSRYYIQARSNIKYKNNVNKLITLNSPHSGSPLGNLVANVDSRFLNSVIDEIGRKILFPCDGSITDGAVYDLAIGSLEMDKINSPSSLINNIVPSHSGVTRINTVPVGTLLYIIAEIIAPTQNINVNDFVNKLFDNSTHDLIVSTISQRGGLTGNSTKLMNDQIFHIGAQKKSEVINHTTFLLQQNPSSSYFSQNGFSPAKINSNYKSSSKNKILTKNNNELIPNSIFINSPSNGSSFNVNQTIDINITSSNGINRIVFYAIDKLNDNNFKEEYHANKVNLKYTISKDTYENINLLALGFNENGLVDYQIKKINVNSNIKVTDIEFLNEEIHIQKDFIAPISINIVYSNGDKKLITNLSDVQITIEDNNIAEKYQPNLLKGNNLGSTILNATYFGYSISTPVLVYESNIEMPDLSTLSNTTFESPILGNDFLIYPNPNIGVFSIKFNSNRNEKIKIIVYNNIGQKIKTFENQFTDENSSKDISLENFKPGIYYLKVLFGTKSKTKKIIIK